MSEVVATLFDTETCSFDGGVVQIGSIKLDKDLNVVSDREDLTYPEREIGIGAMAIHNITPEMVQGKPLLEEVVEHHIPQSGYLLAYNAAFDVKMLAADELEIPEGVKVLCILELARKLYPKYSLKNHGHKNAEMFYGLGCYKDFEYEGELHTALYDCRVTLAVLKTMLKEHNLTLDKAYKLINGEADIPIGERICKMKKFRDMNLTWDQVFSKDRGYCDWMYGNYNFRPEHMELKQWLQTKLGY